MVLRSIGELVGGKSTGFVGAQNSRLFGGGDNGLVLGELLSTDNKSDRQDRGHGNRNTTDQEHQNVVETATVGVVEARVENNDFEDDKDTNSNQTEGTDLGQNLLQVTSSVIVLTNERSSTTEESVGTSGNNNTLSFTLLTG